jgi:hypothetical protein
MCTSLTFKGQNYTKVDAETWSDMYVDASTDNVHFYRCGAKSAWTLCDGDNVLFEGRWTLFGHPTAVVCGLMPSFELLSR